MTNKFQNFKKRLEEEQKVLEGELAGVGRINPDNPADWEPTAGDLNVLQADKNEVADTMSGFEERAAVEVELENRLHNIKKALIRIEDGTYGICAVCDGEIEEKRLDANPAALTCMEHVNETPKE